MTTFVREGLTLLCGILCWEFRFVEKTDEHLPFVVLHWPGWVVSCGRDEKLFEGTSKIVSENKDFNQDMCRELSGLNQVGYLYPVPALKNMILTFLWRSTQPHDLYRYAIPIDYTSNSRARKCLPWCLHSSAHWLWGR